MGSLGWAVSLSVLSAASYAAAAVVQERLARAGHRGLSRWIGALLLTGVGAGLHVAALGFGTVGVVQALGTLTLLFALPIGAFRTHTPIAPAAWRDAGLTVAGLVTIISLTAEPAGPAEMSGSTSRHLAIGTVATVAALTVAAWRAHSPLARSLLLAGAAGAAFAIASVLSKAVLVSFSVPTAGVVAVLAVGGYLLGQLSYRGAGLAAPLAMVTVANPVVAAVVGIVVFGEGFRFGWLGSILAAAAGAVAAWGVIGLSRRTAVVVVGADRVSRRPRPRALPRMPAVRGLAREREPRRDDDRQQESRVAPQGRAQRRYREQHDHQYAADPHASRPRRPAHREQDRQHQPHLVVGPRDGRQDNAGGAHDDQRRDPIAGAAELGRAPQREHGDTTADDHHSRPSDRGRDPEPQQGAIE